MADAEAPAAEPVPPTPTPPAAAVDRRAAAEPLARNAQFVLGLILTLGLFAMWATVIVHPIPQENHDILISLLSAVTTAWVGAMTYFFGSNMASRTKDTAIATLAAKPTGGPNA